MVWMSLTRLLNVMNHVLFADDVYVFGPSLGIIAFWIFVIVLLNTIVSNGNKTVGVVFFT